MSLIVCESRIAIPASRIRWASSWVTSRFSGAPGTGSTVICRIVALGSLGHNGQRRH